MASQRYLHEGVLILDGRRLVVSMNAAMEALLGWQPGEALGLDCAHSLGRYGNSGLGPCHSTCPLLTGDDEPPRTVSHEVVVETEEGKKRTLAFRCWRFQASSDGRVYAVVAAREANASREPVSARAELMSVLAHELRTPLTSIKGCASTLISQRAVIGEERTQDFLRIINEQSDRLRELIDNVLDITRIESGSLKVRPEPVDLRDLVRRVVADLRMRVRERGVFFDYPDDLPEVWVDPRRIEQVLNNLLDNALKYSPAPEPVWVQAARSGEAVVVSVRDRGPGIPTHEVGRIFEKFYRADEVNNRQVRGSGLGLSICRGLVEAHGGTIWVESQIGEGSVFRFTLPLRPTGVAGSRQGDAAPLATRGATIQEPKTALIVAKDERLARFLRAGLEAAEFSPQVLTDEQDLAARVGAGEAAIVLLDGELAGARDLGVLRQLRERSLVPVILIDGRSFVGRRRALEAGADDYLAWPFSAIELSTRARSVLERATPGALPAGQSSLKGGPLHLDLGQQQATLDGKPVHLTPAEFRLLFLLVANAGRAVAARELLRQVWGPDYVDENDYLEAHVLRLRRKLEVDPQRPRYILSEPDSRYRFSASSASA